MAENSAEHMKQRREAVKTSDWALRKIEQYFPFLDDADRNYLREKIDEQQGAVQRMKPPPKAKGA